jgi:hypothetical protein
MVTAKHPNALPQWEPGEDSSAARKGVPLSVYAVGFYLACLALSLGLGWLVGYRLLDVQVTLYRVCNYAWLLLIPFVVVHSFVLLLRRRGGWRILLGPALAIPIVIFLSPEPSKWIVVRDTLKVGRLAVLPASAVEVRALDRSYLFTGERYLRFRVSPEDIERFIADSPALKEAPVESFDLTTTAAIEPAYRGPLTHPDEPEWYRGEVRGKGRRYEISPGNGYSYGEVIIIEGSNVVLVRVVWS